VIRERRRSTLGLAASIVMVVAVVCPWGDFQNHTHWRNVAWVPFASGLVRWVDVVQNVLLFAPLGFFAAGTNRRLLRAAAVAAPLSVVVEWTQLYSHSRFPSATDVVSNVAGALLGAGLASWWDHRRRG